MNIQRHCIQRLKRLLLIADYRNFRRQAVEALTYPPEPTVSLLKGIYDKETRQKRIREVLEAVHMYENKDRKIGGFSGGMKQRIGIAQTLLNLPRILVARTGNVLNNVGREYHNPVARQFHQQVPETDTLAGIKTCRRLIHHQYPRQGSYGNVRFVGTERCGEDDADAYHLRGV